VDVQLSISTDYNGILGVIFYCLKPQVH